MDFPQSTPAPAAPAEEVLWEGSPSQWNNFGYYLVMFLLCWLIVPIGLAIARWLKTRCNRITITTQRLRLRSGVFNRVTEDLELYRVKDLAMEEPFWERLVGLSRIKVYSTDVSTSFFELKGLKNGPAIYEKLRQAVEARRAARRVGITELE